MKPGDLVTDEFNSVGIVIEVNSRECSQRFQDHLEPVHHVLVHFSWWKGWVIEPLLKKLEA